MDKDLAKVATSDPLNEGDELAVTTEPIDDQELKRVMSVLGRRGGRARSGRKAESSRRNLELANAAKRRLRAVDQARWADGPVED